MGLKKNKRGVEALPLRYIIIALVAALVIGIALQFVGILKSGTLGAANQFNESVTEKTTCELDTSKPVIAFDAATVCTVSTNKTTVSVTVTDACGVDEENIGFYTNLTGNTWTTLSLSSGTNKDGAFVGSITNSSFSNGKAVLITVSAKDLTTVANQGTKTNVTTCS